MSNMKASISIAVVAMTDHARNGGDWPAVRACRFVQGLGQGLLHPVIHNLVGKWAPVEERSAVLSLAYSVGHLGTALELLLAGFMAEYWGWAAIFYVNGIVGMVWVVIHFFVGSSSPQQSNTISSEERLYIQMSLEQVGQRKPIKTPWKALFTSVPFLTLIMVHIGYTWGFFTLLTETPTYLNRVQGVQIKSNGALSSLPYFGAFFSTFIFGFISDYILQRGWLSFTLVHLDMAPNHAGTMTGITGLMSSFIAVGAPLIVGYVIHDETQASEWRKVFFVTAGMYIVTNTVLLIFGTSKKQKWNDPVDKDAIDRTSTSGTNTTDKAI